MFVKSGACLISFGCMKQLVYNINKHICGFVGGVHKSIITMAALLAITFSDLKQNN